MSDKKKISTLEADKERLLEALRQLRKEGVTLIDDRVGRPAVLAPKARTEVKAAPTAKTTKNGARAGAVESTQGSSDELSLDNLDRLFIEESATDNDPYNKSIK